MAALGAGKGAFLGGPPSSLGYLGPPRQIRPERAQRRRGSKPQAVAGAPIRVDDSAARTYWGFQSTYDFDRAFTEYLIPTIRQRYETS